MTDTELSAECIDAQVAVRGAAVALLMAAAEWEPAPLAPKPAERVRPLTAQQQAWFDAYSPNGRLSNADWLYGDDPLLMADRPWFR